MEPQGLFQFSPEASGLSPGTLGGPLGSRGVAQGVQTSILEGKIIKNKKKTKKKDNNKLQKHYGARDAARGGRGKFSFLNRSI